MAGSHRAIEDGLHRVLDVAMNRDQTCIRTGHAPEDLAHLHHITLNLPKRDRPEKLGIENKRLAAGREHDHLLRVIMGPKKSMRLS